MALSSLFPLFTYFYILLRMKLHLVYLRISTSINTFFTIRAITAKEKTNPIHTIAVIGDGTAAGVGDSVPFGGSPGVGVGLVNRVFTTAEIRRKWAVVNVGKQGSEASKWDPTNNSSSPNFYKTAFDAPSPLATAVSNSPVVIISLGLTDIIRDTHGFKIQCQSRDPTGTTPTYPESELADVVVNLRSVWRGVREMGKRAVVVGIMPSGAFIER